MDDSRVLAHSPEAEEVPGDILDKVSVVDSAVRGFEMLMFGCDAGIEGQSLDCSVYHECP